MSEYNGYRNYETWNVALWISNDEGLYELAREMTTYGDFQEHVCWTGTDIGIRTPDGVSWNDSGLDINALDELIAEL